MADVGPVGLLSRGFEFRNCFLIGLAVFGPHQKKGVIQTRFLFFFLTPQLKAHLILKQISLTRRTSISFRENFFPPPSFRFLFFWDLVSKDFFHPAFSAGGSLPSPPGFRVMAQMFYLFSSSNRAKATIKRSQADSLFEVCRVEMVRRNKNFFFWCGN